MMMLGCRVDVGDVQRGGYFRGATVLVAGSVVKPVLTTTRALRWCRLLLLEMTVKVSMPTADHTSYKCRHCAADTAGPSSA